MLEWLCVDPRGARLDHGGVGMTLALSMAMALKGIYTAVSGAKAQTQKLDTIANNIANVDTPAFKRDKQVFREYLTSYEKTSDVIEAPRGPASIDSFYPINGGDKSYVDSAGTSTNFSQGSLRNTGNPFDLALEGEGFFEVLTPQGVRYTRNGTFTRNAEGLLVTKQGHPVLLRGVEGQPDQERVLSVGSENFAVGQGGEVMLGVDVVGELSVVSAENMDLFHKEGSSLYSTKETINAQVAPTRRFRLHQGAIEKSNVNIVQEMTDMIKTTRLFESTQKAIQAYDQMNAKLVNDVPKLR